MSTTQVSTYSLSSVLKRIKQIINSQTQNKCFWVRAQVSKINSDRRGNYYLELIESTNGTVIAKCEATIWATQYAVIQAKLKNDTLNILKNGSEILCYASIEYSEIYGLRLQILEIDLSYSLGEIERRKQKSILFLQQNGLLNRNKQTHLPVVIQKIALIGSPNTAGYTDFIKQLTSNDFLIHFKTTTYPCAVQGDKALPEIIEQLQIINTNLYDAIVIVRGGGSKFDLEIFNDLNLAQKIAKMPIPVLTGIGHETDSSIADLVAYKYLKTPTALASFIIDRAHQYLLTIQNTFQNIKECYKSQIKDRNHEINFLIEQIKHRSQNLPRLKRGELHQLSNRVTYISQDLIANQKININTKADKLSFLTKNVLKKNDLFLKEKATYMEAFSKQHLQKNINELGTLSNLIKHFTNNKINKEKLRIEKLVHIPLAYNSQKILNLGYAIVRKNNQVVNETSTWENNEIIEIELTNKKITLTITNVTEQTKWKDIPTKVPH